MRDEWHSREADSDLNVKVVSLNAECGVLHKHTHRQ